MGTSRRQQAMLATLSLTLATAPRASHPTALTPAKIGGDASLAELPSTRPASSPVAVIIAADLRVPPEGTAEFFEQFNQYLNGTDVYVCTDREYEPLARQVENVVLTTYSEDEGGVPEYLTATSAMIRLIQWWRVQQCYRHVAQHAEASGHSYSYIFKMRTDVQLQANHSIMDFYENVVRPSQASAGLRANIASDYVYGGEPRVMEILASLFDEWEPYVNATHCKENFVASVPIDAELLLASDWEAGVLGCLPYPKPALDNASSLWTHSPKEVPTPWPPYFSSNMKELLRADLLAQPYSSDELLCQCGVNQNDANMTIPFLSERSILLHLLSHKVLVQGMAYLQPVLVRYDTTYSGDQKDSLSPGL